jgi:hypothetical protein
VFLTRAADLLELTIDVASAKISRAKALVRFSRYRAAQEAAGDPYLPTTFQIVFSDDPEPATQ